MIDLENNLNLSRVQEENERSQKIELNNRLTELTLQMKTQIREDMNI